jgi:EAL domain-containing protein (putative c-di-GMP-specific phosphodiesterase class I)
VANGRSFLAELIEALRAYDARPNGAPGTDRSHHPIRIAVADPDADHPELIRRALLATDLDTVADLMERQALADAKLDYEVRFQPVVRLNNRSTVGFAPTVHAWSGEDPVPPGELEARAMQGSWLDRLDHLRRELALKGVGGWLGAGLLFLPLATPDAMFDLSSVRRTIRLAEDIGLESDQLVFEASERNNYANPDLAAAQLSKLRRSGVRIGLADVGHAEPTLQTVSGFTPDVLRLSPRLTRALPGPEATALIHTAVDLAHERGAWVVAEAVESEAQAKALRTLQVDWSQGPLFGRAELKPAG